MTRPIAVLFLLGLGFAAAATSDQESAPAVLKLFLNEVQPGAMSAPQFCMLVYSDHRFHSEKADIKHGQDSERRVYEGQLSDADWSALLAIIDSQGFRDLKVPQAVPPLVMQDTHPYTISVARGNNFQNMEFLDNKSLKPYESQIKPLLKWWKSVRSQRISESKAPPDRQCTLDNSHAVYSQ